MAKKKNGISIAGPYTRRGFLMAGAALMAASALPRPAWAGSKAGESGWAEENCKKPYAYDGSTYPYPIPWLDKNGSHNQPAGPDNEPSSIYHFKGKIARCSGFKGMGTDNNGNRLAFGSPTTDNSFMLGQYFTGRAEQKGAFAHL